jgi:alkyl hydroperoxide reductase subunit AhpC
LYNRIRTVANYFSEFQKKEILRLSVDGLESHLKWIKDIEETQNVTLQYPIIADENKEVYNLFDMIHPNADDTLPYVLYLSLS